MKSVPESRQSALFAFVEFGEQNEHTDTKELFVELFCELFNS